jgi:hypothetical protein
MNFSVASTVQFEDSRMIPGPGAIRTRGEVLVVAEDVVTTGCDMSIIVRFIPEGGVPTDLSRGREKKRGVWKSATGKKSPKPKDGKTI